MDTVGRFFLCAGCRVQVLVCSGCDRGQRYCSGTCAQLARLAARREAGRRYQSSRRGRFTHAERMRRYRARQEKVTHQASPPAPEDALLALDSATIATVAPCVDTASVIAPWHCHFCRRRCSQFMRSSFLCGRSAQLPALQQAQKRRGDDDGHSP
jgi:hypothetical protein